MLTKLVIFAVKLGLPEGKRAVCSDLPVILRKFLNLISP
jgi:hypothetical protein